MKTMAHLEEHQLTLRACGPVFIGSGFVYKKNSYLWNSNEATVSFVRQDALMQWILDNGKIDQYENFILYSGQTDLRKMLRQAGISPQAEKELIRYTIKTDGVLDNLHTLKDISAFIRNPKGEAYIPGSSVKGALRTAILFREIQHKDRLAGSKLDKIQKDEYLRLFDQTLDKNAEPLNNLMHGVSVSDSAPVPDTEMTLAAKMDWRQDGQYKKVGLVRECVRPGAQICFRLTLDRAVLGNWLSVQDIREAVESFFLYYREYFSSRFPTRNMNAPTGDEYLFLGGGSGFFSKTLIYPYLGYDCALQEVSKELNRNFKNHHHSSDTEQFGISPHCMKYSANGGQWREFGLCEVKFN